MELIEVVEYNEAWAQTFDLEKQLLAHLLKELSPCIHHIGSTSIAGLSAKPIIDILIEIDDLMVLDRFNAKFEELGYVAKGENGIKERRYFEKGGVWRSHHIHAFLRGSNHALRHLAFRDYLIANTKVAHDYANLKKVIVKTCNNDIKNYCDQKNDFIKKYERIALEWHLSQSINNKNVVF